MKLFTTFALIYIINFRFYNLRSIIIGGISLLKVENIDSLDSLDNLGGFDIVNAEQTQPTIDDYLLHTEFDRHVLTPIDGTEYDIIEPLLFIPLESIESHKLNLNALTEKYKEDRIEHSFEEILFNKHKCMLVVKFEIEFLENPLLHKSGIINYVKDIEISGTGETKIIEPNVLEGKYDVIKHEAKTKKLKKVVSFLNKLFEICNLITNQERLDEFKKTIDYVIFKTENAIEILERKKLDFEKQKNNHEEGASAESEKINEIMENISITGGKIEALSMSLRSFSRIKDYWVHLENLPSVI
ncbi:hypothetical protein FG379_001910 [Cryptosporidium bovis]|uniref:uncharacterized protein n=1 Tax=Cryptosporidium bovis TaxID=310047 RepID=UPI00351A8270|nr:hypothetical protein FG379_001910 [Cryptosporidium bovis]